MSRAEPLPGHAVDVTSVHAALVAEDGRLLLQRRDIRPDIALPGHWGFFGGQVELGETPDQALRRELLEELGLEISPPQWLFEHVCGLPRDYRRLVRRVWFAVLLAEAAIPLLTLHEGAGMALFSLEQMLRLPKVAPWDAAAAMLLLRHDDLFPPPAPLPLPSSLL